MWPSRCVDGLWAVKEFFDDRVYLWSCFFFSGSCGDYDVSEGARCRIRRLVSGRVKRIRNSVCIVPFLVSPNIFFCMPEHVWTQTRIHGSTTIVSRHSNTTSTTLPVLWFGRCKAMIIVSATQTLNCRSPNPRFRMMRVCGVVNGTNIRFVYHNTTLAVALEDLRNACLGDDTFAQ